MRNASASRGRGCRGWGCDLVSYRAGLRCGAASGLRWRPLHATSRATSSSASLPSSWASAPLPRFPGKRGWAHDASSISLPCRSSSIEGEWQRTIRPSSCQTISIAVRAACASQRLLPLARWSAQAVSTVDRSQRGRPTRVAEATKGLPLGRKRDLARWLHAWYSPGGRGGNARRRVALANATSQRRWRLAFRVLPRPGHRWSISFPQDDVWFGSLLQKTQGPSGRGPSLRPCR